MPDSRDLDVPVVVVGCGPIGMTLANLLGVYGVRTLVIERNDALYDHPRAVGTDSDALRTWQAIGLHQRLLEDMTPMGPGGLGMRYLDARGRAFMEVRPAASDSGFAFGYGFVQPLVDRALLDGLTRFDEIEVRFGHELESIEERRDGVHLFGRRTDGERFRLRARHVIACDGGRSTVRRKLGIEMRGSSDRERWLVLDTLEPHPEHGHTGDVEIHCDPRRPSVSVPRRHGHRRFEFLEQPGESESELLADETIRRLLARHVDPTHVRILRRATHVFSGRVAERFRSGRILLAGDAAHVTPPFAAQGLGSGIRDAFNLAWKVALVVRAGASPDLLDTYTSERRPHARASVRLALRLGWLMMPRSRIRAALTQGAIRALLRVPALRDFIREGGPKPVARYRDGFVLRGRGTQSGRMLPQPHVMDAKGARRALDDLLGTGFALLGFGVDPTPQLGEARARWERLGTRFVTVLRQGSVPHGDVPHGEETVLDCDGGFEGRYARLWGRCVLVRPDRFVAFETDPEDVSRALGVLEERLFRPTSPD